MIIGLGVDIVEVSRITSFLNNKSSQQLLRVFTKNEIDYSLSVEKFVSARFAVRFAVKEAFYKAFGQGNFNEIELFRQDEDAPKVILYGATKLMFPENYEILVSVSHSEGYATATVLIQKKQH